MYFLNCNFNKDSNCHKSMKPRPYKDKTNRM